MWVSSRRLAYIGAVVLGLNTVACSGDELIDANGDGIADGVLDPNNVTVVHPTRPLGYVAGLVHDAVTDRPVTASMVRLFGATLAEEVVTEGDGRFQFGPIAAGASFSLNVDHADYADASIAGLTIDDAAGNFPTLNGALFVGPIELLGTTGALRVQVVSEDGLPVPNAVVTVETAVRFFVSGAARGTGAASAQTDADGLARITGLPDVWKLPPRRESSASLVVHVAPVDFDGDGVADLDGQTLALSGNEVRTSALPPVVVLRAPGNAPLRVIASNVAGLVPGGAGGASILSADENISLVLNKPIDRDSILVDLQNEDGTAPVLTSAIVGSLGNLLFIDPATPLEAGREYNLSVRVHSEGRSPVEMLTAAAPFFAEGNRDQPLSVVGRFMDRNDDRQWGTGNDQIVFTVSVPIGRVDRNPAFRIEVFLDLDFNGTSTVGDSPGELPAPGREYPPPLVLNGQEPSAGNGAGLSGFTRFVAPLPVNLPVPISGAAINFEVRFNTDRNDGMLVTTPGGRRAPDRFTGSATLVGP